MAEGFLQSSPTSDKEFFGNKNFNLLLQNSLLQVVDRDKHGRVKRCSMHDLVHDLANFVSNDISKARYIRCKYNEYVSRCISKEETKWSHALSYTGPIYDIMFSDFKCLHALNLFGHGIKELPDSIRELIHLRYLNVSDTCISYLPDSIGELYHLQTIRCFSQTKLPSTLKYLFNLRKLHLHDNMELPPHVGMLTSLETLPYFRLRDQDGHRIVELKSLNNLQGKLKIDNLEKVQGLGESEKAYLVQKSGIIRLVLRWGEIRGGEINDGDVLNGLQPHPNLKFLKIFGFKGASFQLWTLKMAVCLEGHWVGLDNLMEIRLESCEECEEIPMLGHLPCLKSLRLSNLVNVKSIGSSFYNIGSCSSSSKGTVNVFPALQRLELWDMPNLREWVEVEIPSVGGTHEARDVKVFPCLTCLSIQLRMSPSQFTCLGELDIQEMNSGIPLANICGIKLASLAKLIIVGVLQLECLPGLLFHNNRNLSVLGISGCPKLRELPDGLHTLSSLEELKIKYCSNLKSIPCSRINFSMCSLQKLWIGTPIKDSDSWDSASFKKSIYGMLRLGSHSLRELDLGGTELQHLSVLEVLYLIGFGIQELPEWFGKLSSLRAVHLLKCRKLRRLPSVEAMQRLTNLKDLEIGNCPLLKERCNRQNSDVDDDSEWPKISHIPYITVY